MKEHIENKIKEIVSSIEREKGFLENIQKTVKMSEERIVNLQMDLQIHSDALVKEVTKYIPKHGEPPFSTPPEPRKDAPRFAPYDPKWIPDSLKSKNPNGSLKENIFDGDHLHVGNDAPQVS